VNRIAAYTLVLLAFFAAYFASAYGYAGVGANYNLQNYYYSGSNGFVQPSSPQTFYPDLSISNRYAYSSNPSYSKYSYMNYNPYYAPSTAPTQANPQPSYYPQNQPGSTANAYYPPSTPVQAYPNAPGSSTYPPAFYQNSYQAAQSYGNYGEQKYYLNPPSTTQQPQANPQPSYYPQYQPGSTANAYYHPSTTPTQANPQPGYTYDYSGARWLTGPNYWYDSPTQSDNSQPTSSNFPPSFFIGYYSSGQQQQYYDQFQTQAPQPTVTATSPAPSITGETRQVSASGFKFLPDKVTVRQGTAVTWTNQDAMPHTVTSDTGLELNSATLQQGQSYTHTFGATGFYSYHCSVHPTMRATVEVAA